MTKTIKYQVIDRLTKRVIKTYKDKGRARTMREVLDLDYGAYRYFVKEVVI